MSTVRPIIRGRVPAGLLFGVAVIAVEVAAVLAYFQLAAADPDQDLRYLVYPFIWINAGLWAVVRADPQPRSRWHRRLGIAVGVAYFLGVMIVPGNLGWSSLSTPVAARVGWYAPGWGPLVAVTGPVRLYLIPFEVVGYFALAYLVYVTVLDAIRGALAGFLGLATCVGCTVPVVAPLAGLLGGPASGLVTTAYVWSYDLGTLLFVATLGVMSIGHRRHR